MSEENKDQLAEIDQVEISPLSDEDLESVAGGGLAACETCVNTTGCCTTSTPPPTGE